MGFLQQFYAHPVITSLTRGIDGKMADFSYLPSRTFATVIMDLITKDGRIDIGDLESGIKAMPPGDVQRALLSAVQTADSSLDKAQKNIEAWFDDTMDRVSGWYKRFAQKGAIVIALGLTLGLNADTVNMARTLWMNPTLRSQMVEDSKVRASQQPPQTAPLSTQEKKILRACSAGNVQLRWAG